MVVERFVCYEKLIDRLIANIKNEYADMSNGKEIKKHFGRKSKDCVVK